MLLAQMMLAAWSWSSKPDPPPELLRIHVLSYSTLGAVLQITRERGRLPTQGEGPVGTSENSHLQF